MRIMSALPASRIIRVVSLAMRRDSRESTSRFAGSRRAGGSSAGKTLASAKLSRTVPGIAARSAGIWFSWAAARDSISRRLLLVHRAEELLVATDPLLPVRLRGEQSVAGNPRFGGLVGCGDPRRGAKQSQSREEEQPPRIKERGGCFVVDAVHGEK